MITWAEHFDWAAYVGAYHKMNRILPSSAVFDCLYIYLKGGTMENLPLHLGMSEIIYCYSAKTMVLSS